MRRSQTLAIFIGIVSLCPFVTFSTTIKQTPYTITSRNGKYVFVMLPPTGEKRLGTDAYSKSGLYRVDDNRFLWEITSGWEYSYVPKEYVAISDNGRNLILCIPHIGGYDIWGPYMTNTRQVKVFDSGVIKHEFSASKFLRPPIYGLSKKSLDGFRWVRRWNIDDDEGQIVIETELGDVYEVSFASGNVHLLSSSRRTYYIAGFIVISVLIVIFGGRFIAKRWIYRSINETGMK